MNLKLLTSLKVRTNELIIKQQKVVLPIIYIKYIIILEINIKKIFYFKNSNKNNF